MGWIFWLVLAIILIAIGYSRTNNDHYHAGGGIFKNSEYNLDDEKKEISDVEYFNKKGKMK